MSDVSGSGDRHVFRFFVDVVGERGMVAQLAEGDARHARVLHGARAGTPIEVVTDGGTIWRARFDGASGRVELLESTGVVREPGIELLALVTVGGRTDELVDGAVQAGATWVVPVARSHREHAKVAARADRLGRIALAAAKQAKRAALPVVAAPLLVDELGGSGEPGVVVDPAAPDPLDAVLDATWTDPDRPIRLLVGGADGFPPQLVEELVGAGWRRARLGPTILRAELAAAVAVAIATMHAPVPADV